MCEEVSAGENRKLLFLLRNIYILIKREVENSDARKELDNVTGTHGYVICYLMGRDGEDVFQRDIEKRFSIRRSTATEILNLMQKNGLINRSAVESDARLKKITLTDKARNLFKVVEKDRSEFEASVVEGFSSDEIAALSGYLERITENLKKRT